MSRFTDKYLNFIIQSIDLNYILAEAEKEKYQVSLNSGVFEGIVKWGCNTKTLPYNYNISYGVIEHFLKKNYNKIIKINVLSKDENPLDRNIILHVPLNYDINQIKKEYHSVVSCI